MKRSTLLHLRIPFSLFLLPFFIFAAAQSSDPDWFRLILSAIIIHLVFYPSANAYNSYFDKDEGSIGGLENPPPVDKELLYVSYVFELAALALSFLVSWQFAVMVLLIDIAFKAYSHPSVRLKKYPVVGLFTVAVFQGAHTYLMSYMAVNNGAFSDLLKADILVPACLTSFILLGSYPMTQVYQHEEDGKRGDKTVSRMLGIKGTFVWTGVIFVTGIAGMFFYFLSRYNLLMAILLLVFLLPAGYFFIVWFMEVFKDEKAADYRRTMRLNQLSSLCFIFFFLFLSMYRAWPWIMSRFS